MYYNYPYAQPYVQQVRPQQQAPIIGAPFQDVRFVNAEEAKGFMMLQQNPELRTTLTQMQNMAQGRSPQQFVSQLCKQNGIDYDSIMKMF